MNRFHTVSQWLQWLQQFHPKDIDLGLERVTQVGERLSLLQWSCPVITVAGTNGKGSCVASLTAIFAANAYKVGALTSPHLINFNERICVDGQPVEDKVLLEAFRQVGLARGDISLTYFEFTTLAALWIFKQSEVCVLVLEVGMGGRLDAVNMVNPSVAVITSVDLDHRDWLGDNRETIGSEKAGIFRPEIAVVLGEQNPPDSVLRAAEALTCQVYQMGKQYRVQQSESQSLRQTEKQGELNPVWTWQGRGLAPNKKQFIRLQQKPALHPSSVGAAIQASYLTGLALDEEKVARALQDVRLAGRFQIIENQQASVILDVAHNPAAAKNLALQLQSWQRQKAIVGCKVHCVLGILQDKDVAEFVAALKPQVDLWYPCQENTERALGASDLANMLRQNSCPVAGVFQSSVVAYQAVLNNVQQHNNRDIILIVGSFYTIGGWLQEYGG